MEIHVRLSSSFGASRASRLDAILQKKNRVPSNEKRELLKNQTVTASLTISTDASLIKPITNIKSDDAERVKQSASSDLIEKTVEIKQWNAEDQALIDCVLQNWNDALGLVALSCYDLNISGKIAHMLFLIATEYANHCPNA